MADVELKEREAQGVCWIFWEPLFSISQGLCRHDHKLGRYCVGSL